MKHLTRKSIVSITSSIFVGAQAIVANVDPVDAADYLVWGHGNTSCGAFVQNYSAYLRGENVSAYNSDIIWMQGFLTAQNAEWVGTFIIKNGKKKFKPEADLLYGMDVGGLGAWVNSYCSAHPLNILNDAAFALSNVLLDRVVKRMQ